MSKHKHECDACDGKGYFCYDHSNNTESSLFCDEREAGKYCDIEVCEICEGKGFQHLDFDTTDTGYCHRCHQENIAVMSFSEDYSELCESCFKQFHAQWFPDCKVNGEVKP